MAHRSAIRQRVAMIKVAQVISQTVVLSALWVPAIGVTQEIKAMTACVRKMGVDIRPTTVSSKPLNTIAI